MEYLNKDKMTARRNVIFNRLMLEALSYWHSSRLSVSLAPKPLETSALHLHEYLHGSHLGGLARNISWKLIWRFL